VKRPYESMIVFDGTIPEDVLHKEQAHIEDFLKQSAVFERTDVWGKRGLAYPIRKKKIGYYCLFLYEGEGATITALERQLKLNEKVLRYLTVARDMKKEAGRAAFFARREKAAGEAAAAKPVAPKQEEAQQKE
jgi:small subunit ribosomal protein S6